MKNILGIEMITLEEVGKLKVEIRKAVEILREISTLKRGKNE